jgi:hypothetical protein
MTPNEQHLRSLLTFQGLFYLAINLWALIATPSFLGYANPQGDLFAARSFAALCLVLAVYFLVGAWRSDLLRPTSFLGLGSSGALALVELFHLPLMGWTILWFDLAIELALAGLYIAVIFFRKEEEKAVVAAFPPQATADEARDSDALKDDPTLTGDPVVTAADEGTDVRDEIAVAENADEGSEDAK